MNAHTLTVTVNLNEETVRSGDDVAAVLHRVAATLANRYDGLTLPGHAGGHIEDRKGQDVGEWVIA